MQHKKTLLLVVFSIYLAAGMRIVENDNYQRISGSSTNNPKYGSHSFAVSITLNDLHICGGFVYNQNFIVTTAFCVFGKSPAEIHAIIGEHTINVTDSGEQRMQIRTIITHEQYNATTLLNDIALLETSKGIVFSEHVSPAYLNAIQTNSPLLVDVYGWGAKIPHGPASDEIQSGLFPIRSECREFPFEEEYFPNQMFCAGLEPYYETNNLTSYAALCQYDEGSPAMQFITSEYYVVGLASKHLTCGEDPITNSTIYTRLSAYYPWLNRNAGTQPPMPQTTTSTTTTTLPTTYLPITLLSDEPDYM